MNDYLLEADNPVGRKQKRPFFKRKRAGELLTVEQIRAIKGGRKLLRKELRAQGLKKKEDLELTASAMGLYFDKGKFLGFLWFLHGRGLWALIGAAALLMSGLFAFSIVTQMQGHFTINMSDAMFKEGFVLSETQDFANPTTHLFCTPAENVPCISITHIPDDIDDYEGQHNENYFAYTFWLRNEGNSTVGYHWSLNLNSESRNLSDAVWVMIFEDGEMLFYAKQNELTHRSEALPTYGDDTKGYIRAPLFDQNKSPELQYEVITQRKNLTYYRVLPIPFISESTVADGAIDLVEPMEVHKYTVVIWLEGDDPQCTDELIGGHVGMEIFMQLVGEETDQSAGDNGWRGHWDSFWDSLKFWKN